MASTPLANSEPLILDLAGRGNGGVAAIVKQIPYSIGYVELAYAIENKLPYGSVQNQAGKGETTFADLGNDFRQSGLGNGELICFESSPDELATSADPRIVGPGD